MQNKKIDKIFKIYSSSAGSGKTYTLTKEYLKLALMQEEDMPHAADYFRHILAITFTNDATNEMKERIVKDLKGFAYPETLTEKERNRSEDKLTKIAEEIHTDKEKIRKRAKNIFSKILYNYTDFSVSTIDKFVNKVTNAFTRELEIPYNYEIELDQDTLIKNATDRVLEKIGYQHNKIVSDFVIGWIKEKVGEGEDWTKIGNELASVAKQLMNEKAYKSIRNLMQFEIEDFQILMNYAKKFQKDVEKKFKELAEKGLKIIHDSGIPENAFSNTWLPDYFKKFIHKLEEGLSGQGMNRALGFINSNGSWCPKPQKNKVDYTASVEVIRPQLLSIITEIEDLRNGDNKQKFYLYDLILPHIPKLALLKEIEKELEEVKRENNAIHISDSTKKIAEIIANEPVPYIYERVGERYNHILIDEFQDTSILQWHNLLPLVENGLAEGNFNLIVGDAKQAIYRWRGGEMEQLVYLYKGEFDDLLEFLNRNHTDFEKDRYNTLALYHTPEQLNSNYRSTKEIIEFNNDFFDTLKNTKLGETYQLFPKVYDESFAQKFPENPDMIGGRVEIHFLDQKNQKDYTPRALEKTLELILQLKNEGWSLGQITLLVRKNQEGSSLANYLKEHNIDVVSAEALLLSNDDKVIFLVALLKVLYRPDDKMSKHIALSWFYKVVKKHIPTPDENNEIGNITEKSILAFYDKFKEEGFELNFTKLATLNLYELTEKLISIFNLLENQPNLEYLFCFLDVLLKFSQQKQATLNDFIDYWDKKGSKVSINASPANQAVVITTIHKSKGLEYPIVIMPFVTWDLYPQHQSQLWIDLEPNDLSFEVEGKTKYLPTALVNYNQRLEQTSTYIKQQYHSEKEKSFLENLNLLYVAFTRPVYRLYLLTNKEKVGSDGLVACKTVGGLLQLYISESENKSQRLDDLNEAPVDFEGLYLIKDGNLVSQENKKATNEEIFLLEDMTSTDIHKKLKLKNLKK